MSSAKCNGVLKAASIIIGIVILVGGVLVAAVTATNAIAADTRMNNVEIRRNANDIEKQRLHVKKLDRAIMEIKSDVRVIRVIVEKDSN